MGTPSRMAALVVAPAFATVFFVGMGTFIAIPIVSFVFFVLFVSSVILGIVVVAQGPPVVDPLRCAGCRYDLSGLGRRGRCPECGGLYDLDTPPPDRPAR